MGGEMAYILEQRLQAQNVGNEKSIKVLCDIVAVMLGNSFLDELFEPKEMMSRQGLRQFFEQIAHSSVMRLNEASMDKLFDLMVMAVKYQFLLCKEPSELVLVTMNHIDGMKTIFQSNQQIMNHLDYANTLLMDHFGDTPLWQMAIIRSELLNFLHGARVKVSLMLREHKQMEDGRFVLFPEGEQIELPYNAVVPGSVKYVENGALVRSEHFPVDEHFKVSPDSVYQDRTMVRGTNLGQNMYKTNNETEQIKPSSLNPTHKTSKISQDISQKLNTTSGDEIGLLSMLIKNNNQQIDDFELVLFEDEIIGGESKNIKKENKTKNPTIGKKAALDKALNEMNIDKNNKQKTPLEKSPSKKGKELLEMMDQTVEKKPLPKRSGSAKRGGGGV
uniref:Protein OSCP1 n=1 Tax=Meloidogyne hapla TaxID=6305 RepID=A0A1I8BFH7_MELHA